MAFEEEGIGNFLFGNVNIDGKLEQEDDFWNDADIRQAFSLKKHKNFHIIPPTSKVLDERLVQRAFVAPHNDFAEFDCLPSEKESPTLASSLDSILPLPTKEDGLYEDAGDDGLYQLVNRFAYPGSLDLKFTEVFNPQWYAPPRRRVIIPHQPLEEQESEPLRYAPDEQKAFLSLHVKYRPPQPTRRQLPLAPTASPQPILEGILPCHSELPANPVEYMDWENDINWGSSDEEEAKDEHWLSYCHGDHPKTLEIDWAEDAIVWDDSRPTSIPIPKVIIDLRLPNLSLVPRKQSKKVITPRVDWLSWEPERTPIPIRKRPSTSVTCHAPIAMSLTLVPWQMNDQEARQFHRPRHSLRGSFPLKFLPEEQSFRHLPFGVQGQADLSAADNTLILLEYSEQNPPLLQNIGMASKLRNYYSQASYQDAQYDLPPDELGENVSLAPDDASPFLGKIPPGQRMYGLENHLYKAPLFRHPSNDFLLIQNTEGQWLLRPIPHLFTVGQILPLQKVPSPSSNTATTYANNRLVSFVTMLLRASPRILLSEIKEQFPNETEPAIRQILRTYCTFKRSGEHGQCWILRPNITLNSEAALRASPEQVCINESSQASLVRLKDNGVKRFNNSYALTEAQELLHGTENEALRAIEAEVQLMPWNASATFCDVMRGRLKHSIHNAESAINDQFAFAKTRTDARIIKDSKESEKVARRDDGSDLRTVLVKDACRFLIEKAGMAKEEVSRLHRWPLINLMREKATEMAEAGSTDAEVLLFARRTLPNTDARQNEFLKRAQHIFDRMVSYCTATEEEDAELDRFEQELLDLLDDVGEQEAESPAKEKPRRAAGPKASTAKRQKQKEEVPTEAEEAALAAELKANLAAKSLVADNEDLGRVICQLPRGGASRFSKIVRKTSTILHEDGSRTQKTEYIRDLAAIDYLLRKKRNLEQKRSNIGSLLLEDLMDEEGDQFYQKLLEACQEELQALRDSKFPKLPKPKQVTLGIAEVAGSSQPNLTKMTVRNSLWYSFHVFEEDDATPVVRCGPHAPLYRSYSWRKNKFTRMDAEDAMLLRGLKPSVLNTCCQHREQEGGPICGRTYIPVGSLTNGKFIGEVASLSKAMSEKIECGYFLPNDYADKMFA